MDIQSLPFELQNKILYYYPEHPLAKIIKQRVNYMYFKKSRSIKDMDHLANNHFDMNVVKHLYYRFKREEYLEDNYLDRTRNTYMKMQDFKKLFNEELIHKFNKNTYKKEKWFDREKEEFERYLDEKFISHHFRIDSIKFKLYIFLADQIYTKDKNEDLYYDVIQTWDYLIRSDPIC
jgi:hypothetical protein